MPQELLSLQHVDEVTDANEGGLDGLPDWTPALTPFSSLLAKEASSAAASRGDRHNQFGLPGRKELDDVSKIPASLDLTSSTTK